MISGEWISMLLVTGGLILVAVVAHRLLPLLKRNGGPNHPLKHLGSLALTPQCSVALVQIGGETLILGIGAQSVSLLAKASGPAPEEDLQTARKATGHDCEETGEPTATIPGRIGKGFSDFCRTLGKRR